VGAAHVPLAVQHGTAAAIRNDELEVRELVPNTKAAYGDVQFGTKGPPKEWFEWCCLGPNVVFHGVKTPITKIQYNPLVTPEKVTQYFNEHLSTRALMNSNGNRWVGTVLYKNQSRALNLKSTHSLFSFELSSTIFSSSAPSLSAYSEHVND